MARLIVATTGSVAAIRTPTLVEALDSLGHEVTLVATESAFYFFDPAAIPGLNDPSPRVRLYRDADEWPPPAYHRGDPVLHIELRKWADLLLVAPLDANTLAKFALGLADNLLTCLFRAWDFEKPVLLAPAMNTMMWHSPVTHRHLSQLLNDHGNRSLPDSWLLSEAEQIFASHSDCLGLISPQEKELACGDVGMGAMAEVSDIVGRVQKVLGH